MSTVLVLIGYAMFFFAEHSLILIAVAAVIIFVGEAFIQLLMKFLNEILMMLIRCLGIAVVAETKSIKAVHKLFVIQITYLLRSLSLSFCS